jgi:hypothetical protein
MKLSHIAEMENKRLVIFDIPHTLPTSFMNPSISTMLDRKTNSESVKVLDDTSPKKGVGQISSKTQSDWIAEAKLKTSYLSNIFTEIASKKSTFLLMSRERNHSCQADQKVEQKIQRNSSISKYDSTSYCSISSGSSSRSSSPSKSTKMVDTKLSDVTTSAPDYSNSKEKEKKMLQIIGAVIKELPQVLIAIIVKYYLKKHYLIAFGKEDEYLVMNSEDLRRVLAASLRHDDFLSMNNICRRSCFCSSLSVLSTYSEAYKTMKSYVNGESFRFIHDNDAESQVLNLCGFNTNRHLRYFSHVFSFEFRVEIQEPEQQELELLQSPAEVVTTKTTTMKITQIESCNSSNLKCDVLNQLVRFEGELVVYPHPSKKIYKNQDSLFSLYDKNFLCSFPSALPETAGRFNARFLYNKMNKELYLLSIINSSSDQNNNNTPVKHWYLSLWIRRGSLSGHRGYNSNELWNDRKIMLPDHEIPNINLSDEYYESPNSKCTPNECWNIDAAVFVAKWNSIIMVLRNSIYGGVHINGVYLYPLDYDRVNNDNDNHLGTLIKLKFNLPDCSSSFWYLKDMFVIDNDILIIKGHNVYYGSSKDRQIRLFGLDISKFSTYKAFLQSHYPNSNNNNNNTSTTIPWSFIPIPNLVTVDHMFTQVSSF